jgi:hypothetical protein
MTGMPVGGDRPDRGFYSDSRPAIPTDDWDDQDLLTKDEARLRLEHSAGLLSQQLADAHGSDPAASAALELQVRRIEKVLKNLRAQRQGQP